MSFLRTYALALTVCSSIALYSLPQGPEAVHGQLDIAAQQDLLQVATGEKAIIHWKDFSIQKDEIVHFIQPSQSSAILNRVTGKEASHLLGQLIANGKIYLVNPNGVVIGKEGVIRASDFLASTLDLSDTDFLLGAEQLFKGDSNEAIINYGMIEAMGGNVMLIGKTILNEGMLKASEGSVSLAGGQEILLQPENISILAIRPSIDSEGSISQEGKIEALFANLQAEGGAYAQGINLKGAVLALNTVEQNGRIYLKAEGITIEKEAELKAPSGEITIETGKGLYQEGALIAEGGSIQINNYGEESPIFHLGKMDASGLEGGSIEIKSSKFMNAGSIVSEGERTGGLISIETSGPYIETNQAYLSVSGKERGGTIFLLSDTSLFSSGRLEAQGAIGGKTSITAPNLTLMSADINNSGTSQGGHIFIGSLKDENRTAKTVHLGGNTSLSVNATESGNGGTIVILSEDKTICYGSIEANGAPLGQGGMIEISGKDKIYCGASLSAHAKGGISGTVLLDPKNITVDVATGGIPQFEYIDPNSSGGTGFGTVVFPLSTGNVVITKPGDNFSAADSGAVYLYDATSAALISTLVGSTANDQVGSAGVTALTNGNYVVKSVFWNNGAATSAGAATFGNGTTGITGAVSAANSLVGTTSNDRVGNPGVTALTNGNYVVGSTFWNNGAATSAGAATFGDGTTGISGAVSAANSLVGTTSNDRVGSTGVTALTNGNYVVKSPAWDTGGLPNVGAATFGDGTVGISGAVSAANSLIGSSFNDNVGGTVVALTNGNYVAASATWDNTGAGASNAGAATLGDGTTGTTGVVSAANSLVGSILNDNVGSGGVTALTNGDYVVQSPNWDNGGTADAGAATLGDGTAGISGAVSTANSLVGEQASSSLQTIVGDSDNGVYFAIFLAEGSGKVRVGLTDPSQVGYAIAPSQDMNIAPLFLTSLLDAGTSVTLQANNDLTISSPIANNSGGAALNLSAGRSALINADITLNNASLTVTANDLLASGVDNSNRDAGDAVLSVGDQVVINVGSGSLTLELLNGEGKTNAGSGDLSIGEDAQLLCSGSGAINLSAQENNILLGAGSLIQAANGNITLTAGSAIEGESGLTMETTGSGQLILISDALFPDSPDFGEGYVSLPSAVLETNGGKLLIYTSDRSLNTMPATINGTPFTPGPELVDSVTEKWGVYYPNSSGIPFTIFYKTGAAEPSSGGTSSSFQEGVMTGIAGSFQVWINPWYNDFYFANDAYPPYLTPKNLMLGIPSLAKEND